MAVTPDELEIKIKFGTLVRPGDTLILGVVDHFPRERADEMRAKLQELIPGLGNVVFVLGVEAMATFRPGSVEKWMFAPDACPNLDHPFSERCTLCGYKSGEACRG